MLLCTICYFQFSKQGDQQKLMLSILPTSEIIPSLHKGIDSIVYRSSPKIAFILSPSVEVLSMRTHGLEYRISILHFDTWHLTRVLHLIFLFSTRFSMSTNICDLISGGPLFWSGHCVNRQLITVFEQTLKCKKLLKYIFQSFLSIRKKGFKNIGNIGYCHKTMLRAVNKERKRFINQLLYKLESSTGGIYYQFVGSFRFTKLKIP